MTFYFFMRTLKKKMIKLFGMIKKEKKKIIMEMARRMTTILQVFDIFRMRIQFQFNSA